jgi:hypothetical protein
MSVNDTVGYSSPIASSLDVLLMTDDDDNDDDNDANDDDDYGDMSVLAYQPSAQLESQH